MLALSTHTISQLSHRINRITAIISQIPFRNQNGDCLSLKGLRASMAYDRTNQTHNQIHDLVNKNDKKIFVFMKGTPKEPACRYSGIVVQLLDAYGVEFNSCDVLENEEIRKEIKTYSDWPTIPQVFSKGSFIGGCDILLQMHQSGEIKQLTEEQPPNTDPDMEKK